MRKTYLVRIHGRARAGKDSFARYLREAFISQLTSQGEDCNCFIAGYADHLKCVAEKTFGWSPKKKNESAIDVMGANVVYRCPITNRDITASDFTEEELNLTFLQFYGSEVCRKHDPMTWVRSMKATLSFVVQSSRCRHILCIIPDARLENELTGDLTPNEGPYSREFAVKIVRKDFDAGDRPDHISEQPVKFPFHREFEARSGALHVLSAGARDMVFRDILGER